jgi:hypothetical protein
MTMATPTQTEVGKIRAAREQVLAEQRALAAAPLPRQEAHALLEDTLARAAEWSPPVWLHEIARGHAPAPAELGLFVSSAQAAEGAAILPASTIPAPRQAGGNIEIPAQRAVVRTLTTSLTDRARDGFLLAVAGPAIAEVLHARLEALYEANAWDATAVPAAERATRREALAERLDGLELKEELAIVRAELAGMVIDRRPDARGAVLFDERVLVLEQSA